MLVKGGLILKLSQFGETLTNNSYNETDKESAGFKHDLPAPQEGTLDAAIEKATRAAVRSIRDYLETFSQDTAEHFLQ